MTWLHTQFVVRVRGLNRVEFLSVYRRREML